VNFRTLSAMALPVKTVLAIGETGAGKSFLCNQLVGWPAFDESDDTKSKTDKCTREIAADRSMGVEYHVIDTIGLCDTHKSEEEVHSCLSEFARLAPNGIDAVLCVVTLTGGRLTAHILSLCDKMESYFGESVWESAIVVFNNNKKTPAQIWNTESSPSIDKVLQKWRESGTVICTVPRGKEDDNGNLVVESISPQIRLLKQAIVNTSKVYDSDEFGQVRQEFDRKAKEAEERFKPGHWRRKMREANVLLLQGKLRLEEWERQKTELLHENGQADSELRLAQHRTRDERTRADRLQQQLDDTKAKRKNKRKQRAGVACVAMGGGATGAIVGGPPGAIVGFVSGTAVGVGACAGMVAANTAERRESL